MIKPVALVTAILLTGPAQSSKHQDIDAFFRAFTDEWVRGNPNLATSTRCSAPTIRGAMRNITAGLQKCNLTAEEMRAIDRDNVLKIFPKLAG
jgi:hypothetical protein